MIPPGYHGLDAQRARLDALVTRGARLGEAGRSVHGRIIPTVELGPPDARRLSVIIGGIHPLEWIGVETAFTLLEQLACTPRDNLANLDNLIDRRVLALPIVNIDGYAEVEADLVAGRRRFRRANAGGVDLNRNFPTHFRRTPRLPTGWNHGGPAPLSEPEVHAVVRTLDAATRNGTRLERALSLHSFGRMLLTPWGGRDGAPARAEEHLAAARAVQARLAPVVRYRVRQSSRWVRGLVGFGMELDHLYARYDALTILCECSAGGFSRTDPTTWLAPFRWFNPSDPRATAEVLANALEPFLRGG